jgi:N-acetylmuramoyl-L-alanine amidase
LVIGADTARVALPLNLAPISSRVGVARPPAGAPPDWTLRGRASTAGPYHWFFPPGTRLELTGERNGFVRARLAPDLSAWVPKAEVDILPIGAAPPRVDVGGVRFIAAPGHVDLRIPLGVRLPFAVEGTGRNLVIDVYGGTSETNFFQFGSLDPLIARAMWSQPADAVYRVSIELSAPVWGYLAFYDGDVLVLRMRRPPEIDADRPLSGLRIGVDAGHPPAGSIGPTRLTEAAANLPIALELKKQLEAAGATVLMTRTDTSSVELGLRPRMATDSNTHILVSIHNNAFPDGVNPFENAGTSVYFYQPHSLDLARLVQRELLASLGTRDIGIGRADLAVVRPTWMPSILSETLYMMVPQHEAALRDPATHERIAAAHVRALEAFLRERVAN